MRNRDKCFTNNQNVPQTEECEANADSIEWVEDKRAQDMLQNEMGENQIDYQQSKSLIEQSQEECYIFAFREVLILQKEVGENGWEDLGIGGVLPGVPGRQIDQNRK